LFLLIVRVRCKKWVINTRRGDLEKKTLEELHKNYFLCSAHFEENQFTNKLRNKLNWNAIPTLFNVSHFLKLLKIVIPRLMLFEWWKCVTYDLPQWCYHYHHFYKELAVWQRWCYII